ncbi:helix-turn-helix domain-containing protein [Paenibacillus sp. MCAF9]|uniref:helix-turn-helix domain-containing protein n=1 Tax=Paenibacillus sp. MCAF9 TaxID=3233046 RepID=UPI003F9A1F63
MNNDILKLVGEKIREVRKEKGLTQEQLGEMADFTYSYIGRIERGQKNISLQNLDRIARILDVPVHRLFDYEYEYSKLTNKGKLVSGILDMLIKQDESDLSKSKVILKEIFGDKSRN